MPASPSVGRRAWSPGRGTRTPGTAGGRPSSGGSVGGFGRAGSRSPSPQPRRSVSPSQVTGTGDGLVSPSMSRSLLGTLASPQPSKIEARASIEEDLPPLEPEVAALTPWAALTDTMVISDLHQLVAQARDAEDSKVELDPTHLTAIKLHEATSEMLRRTRTTPNLEQLSGFFAPLVSLLTLKSRLVAQFTQAMQITAVLCTEPENRPKALTWGIVPPIVATASHMLADADMQLAAALAASKFTTDAPANQRYAVKYEAHKLLVSSLALLSRNEALQRAGTRALCNMCHGGPTECGYLSEDKLAHTISHSLNSCLTDADLCKRICVAFTLVADSSFEARTGILEEDAIETVTRILTCHTTNPAVAAAGSTALFALCNDVGDHKHRAIHASAGALLAAAVQCSSAHVELALSACRTLSEFCIDWVSNLQPAIDQRVPAAILTTLRCPAVLRDAVLVGRAQQALRALTALESCWDLAATIAGTTAVCILTHETDSTVADHACAVLSNLGAEPPFAAQLAENAQVTQALVVSLHCHGVSRAIVAAASNALWQLISTGQRIVCETFAQHEGFQAVSNLGVDRFSDSKTVVALGGVLRLAAKHSKQAQVQCVSSGILPLLVAALAQHFHWAALVTAVAGALEACVHDAYQVAAAAAMNALPELVHSLDEHASQPACLIAVFALLAELAASSLDRGRTIVGADGAEAIVSALSAHPADAEVQYWATAALCELSAVAAVDPKVAAIVTTQGGILAILTTMKRHIDNADIQYRACMALNRFTSVDPANQLYCVGVDAHSVVIRSLRQLPDASLVQGQGCLVLSNLARANAASCDALVEKGAIAVMVAAMRRVESDAPLQSHTCHALAAVARASLVAATYAVEEGGCVGALRAIRAHAINLNVVAEATMALCAMIEEAAPTAAHILWDLYSSPDLIAALGRFAASDEVVISCAKVLRAFAERVPDSVPLMIEQQIATSLTIALQGDVLQVPTVVSLFQCTDALLLMERHAMATAEHGFIASVAHSIQRLLPEPGVCVYGGLTMAHVCHIVQVMPLVADVDGVLHLCNCMRIPAALSEPRLLISGSTGMAALCRASQLNVAYVLEHGGVETVVHVLTHMESNVDVLMAALEAFLGMVLVIDSASRIAEGHGIQPVINAAELHPRDDVRDRVLQVLHAVVLTSPDTRPEAMDTSIVAFLVKMIRTIPPGVPSQTLAAELVERLSRDAVLDRIRKFVEAGAIDPLVAIVRHAASAADCVQAACQVLTNLAADARSCEKLVNGGATLAIIKTMLSRVGEYTTQLEGCSALRRMADNSTDGRFIIVDNRGLKAIALALSECGPAHADVVAQAAVALQTLTAELPDNQSQAGAEGAVAALVRAMPHHAHLDHVQLAAIRCLFAVLNKNTLNKRFAMKAGVVSALSKAMSAHESHNVVLLNACEVLYELAELSEVKQQAQEQGVVQQCVATRNKFATDDPKLRRMADCAAAQLGLVKNY